MRCYTFNVISLLQHNKTFEVFLEFIVIHKRVTQLTSKNVLREYKYTQLLHVSLNRIG